MWKIEYLHKRSKLIQLETQLYNNNKDVQNFLPNDQKDETRQHQMKSKVTSSVVMSTVVEHVWHWQQEEQENNWIPGFIEWRDKAQAPVHVSTKQR